MWYVKRESPICYGFTSTNVICMRPPHVVHALTWLHLSIDHVRLMEARVDLSNLLFTICSHMKSDLHASCTLLKCCLEFRNVDACPTHSRVTPVVPVYSCSYQYDATINPSIVKTNRQKYNFSVTTLHFPTLLLTVQNDFATSIIWSQ